MVGPSKLLSVPGALEDEHGVDVPSGTDIPLMLVDFTLSVLPLIREYDPAQDVHEIQSFLEETPHVVPASNIPVSTSTSTSKSIPISSYICIYI